ncbi:entry exclusion protein 1 [Azotobacter chroococcum]|uniref:entry exclusion protein 1 n=1 Tax=Azotobacter chroococcum TaxID=353 RepID=UPI0010AE2F41|nr:entry exclusion protein 1 [Azotobacter chroococcum]TKD45997.1 entry exclusion protein 1 [Azotobacter chroococcum]
MWHTLAQAIELTGRSRRSLYRDMDEGRVSYRVRDDGRRELETSELIRAYGPLRAVAQPGTQSMAHSGTPVGTPSVEPLVVILEELKSIREENRLLRQEVRELREVMLLLEHKPSSPPAVEVKKAESFADLLRGLDGN